MTFLERIDLQARTCCSWKGPGYDVDGREFMNLWTLVQPYVHVSVISFCKVFAYANISLFREDIEADVRERAYLYLRKWGPTRKGHPFSVTIKALLFETFSRLMRQMFDLDKYKVNHNTISIDWLPDVAQYAEFVDSFWAPNVDYRMDALSMVDEKYKPVVQNILDGHNLSTASRMANMHNFTASRYLRRAFSN